MTDKKCTYDPTKFKEQPIGMFHCPECGEMILAGVPHLNYSILEKDYEDKILKRNKK